MWGLIIGGLTELAKGWFETKRAKQKAEAEYHAAALKGEQDYDLEAMKQARYSWKDELITLVWFAPLVVAWFEPAKAQAWIAFVAALPLFYQIGMFGIMAATFGLRWYFKRQNFVVGERKG